MAEWSCSGLQLRVRRFDSDPSLHILVVRRVDVVIARRFTNYQTTLVVLKALSVRLAHCPDGEIGRHKGFKIPRSLSVPVQVRLRAPFSILSKSI